MLELDHISYRHHPDDEPVVNDMSLRIEQGSISCVLGVNGCGKSTLLGIIAGILIPFQGQVLVDGQDLRSQYKQLRKKISLVFQDPDVCILGSTVQEDMLLGVTQNQVSQQLAQELAQKFALETKKDALVHTLSYGQKKKLTIASALMPSPQLLLLDEPFAGLDMPSIDSLRTILIDNKKAGMTQVLVAHDLDLVADLVDTFILMKDGAIIAHGQQDTVFSALLENGVRPPCWWYINGKHGPLWK